ncbi:MAG: YkgJ family cysteine cluster protein [Treponemataceae bacterium]|nr:YkgJ family cysteine cluster protein [Treponemataceae bacterium]
MEPFYKDGLRFECRRCSFCCGHSPGFVYLSRADLERLCAYFSVGERQFVEENCRWADYYGGRTVLALKEKRNYDCWLWDGGCTAYSARPVQCETYPFWSWMLSDEAVWTECAADCPGMNEGRLWSREEIEECRRRCSGNRPLERAEFLRGADGAGQ